eukprot:366490-Chlamydomonas_euryale.AAC.39
MQQANPVELSIGNVVRRVLHLIREEARDETMNDPQQPERSDGGGAEASSNPGMVRHHGYVGEGVQLVAAARVSCVSAGLGLYGCMDPILGCRPSHGLSPVPG